MTGARGGFALIASLWLIVALSALGASVGLRSRQSRLAAANVIELSRAEAVALGALEEARSILQTRLDERASTVATDPWTYLQRQDSSELGGVEYTLEYRDLGARLQLNRASEDELRRLLRALRIDWGEADRVAQAIADWRDPDDFPRGRGAERAHYLELGAIALPANRPFGAVRELRYVRGIDEDLLDRVAPHVSIDGSGEINVNSASREVLLTLKGVNEEAAELILRLRRSPRGIRALNDIANDLSPTARETFRVAMPELQTRVIFEIREMEVIASAWVKGSPARLTARGLFARGGSTAFFVRRRVE
jgi:general secretion pathway protein K